MSRTKRKSIYITNLKRGINWFPGNPEFDKWHPNVSKKEFEENVRKYGIYMCNCSWCRLEKRENALRKRANDEIKEFKYEPEKE